MEHLKSLVFVLVLYSFGYAIIQIIKLFGHGVVALYTVKDPTLLVVFCVATAVVLALAYAVACVANWILPPDYSSNLPEYREAD
jgi:hypothetical protein